MSYAVVRARHCNCWVAHNGVSNCGPVGLVGPEDTLLVLGSPECAMAAVDL